MATGHGGGGPSRPVSNHSALAQPAPSLLFQEGELSVQSASQVHATRNYG
jgi:hypothetical protein